MAKTDYTKDIDDNNSSSANQTSDEASSVTDSSVASSHAMDQVAGDDFDEMSLSTQDLVKDLFPDSQTVDVDSQASSAMASSTESATAESTSESSVESSTQPSESSEASSQSVSDASLRSASLESASASSQSVRRSNVSAAEAETSSSTVVESQADKTVEKSVASTTHDTSKAVVDNNLAENPDWIKPYQKTYGDTLEHLNQDKNFDRQVKSLIKRDAQTNDTLGHAQNRQELYRTIMYHYYGQNPTPEQHQPVINAMDKYSFHDVANNALRYNHQDLHAQRQVYLGLQSLLSAHANHDNQLAQKKATADKALTLNQVDLRDYQKNYEGLQATATPLTAEQRQVRAQSEVQAINASKVTASQATDSTTAQSMQRSQRAESLADSVFDETARSHSSASTTSNDSQSARQDDPNQSIADSVFDDTAKQNAGSVNWKKIWGALKDAGHAVGDEYQHQKHVLFDKVSKQQWDAQNQQFNALASQNTPYTKARDTIWNSFSRDIQYEKQLEQYQKQYQHADTDTAKMELKKQITGAIAFHESGEHPTPKQFASVLNQMDSDKNVFNVTNHYLNHSRQKTNQDVLRLSTLEGYISKSNQVNDHDTALANSAATTDKSYLPNETDLKSLASYHFDYPDNSSAVNTCYQFAKSTAVESLANSSAQVTPDAVADIDVNSASQAVPVDSANDSNATWKKTSKAAHEQQAAGPANASDVTPINNQDAQLSKASLRIDDAQHSRNKAGQKTMNKDIEQQGATQTEKVVDSTVDNTAAQTAANTHESVNAKLAKEVAALAKKVQDKQQREALEKQKRELEAQLGKKGFMQELIDAWNVGRGKDKDPQKGHVFIKGAIRGGVGAVKLSAKLATGAALVATGVVSGAVHLLSRASRHVTKHFDKSVARGFAPTDANGLSR